MSQKLIKKLFLNKESLKMSMSDIKETHKEGDVWVEDGKEWTIKDDIKMNKSSLSDIRKTIFVPHKCPKCNKAMTKRLDPKFFKLFNICFDCKIEEDNQRIIDGTFDDYEQEFMNKNKKTFLKDVQEYVTDFIDNTDGQHVVNEFGDIEEWEHNTDKTEMKEMFDKRIEKMNDELLDET